jgi:hypothetical protein
MHREQLANIVAVEGNEIRDLLAFRLGETHSLASFDLEADVSGRRQGDRYAGGENRGCARHAGNVLFASGIGTGHGPNGSRRA